MSRQTSPPTSTSKILNLNIILKVKGQGHRVAYSVYLCTICLNTCTTDTIYAVLVLIRLCRSKVKVIQLHPQYEHAACDKHVVLYVLFGVDSGFTCICKDSQVSSYCFGNYCVSRAFRCRNVETGYCSFKPLWQSSFYFGLIILAMTQVHFPFAAQTIVYRGHW